MTIPAETPIGRSAVRVGATVRRPASACRAAIHALLRHLASEGIVVPQPLGVDERGREVLAWLSGESGQTATGLLRPSVQTDEILVHMAELLRRVHDATIAFPSESYEWEPLLRGPVGSAPVVCHNDVSFQNTVFRDGAPVALIDWEFAAPGSRMWDLAYAAWCLVPLHRPEAAEALGWLKLDQPRRLRLFVDAYGLGSEREELLDVIYRRQAANRAQLRQWVQEGVIPAFNENDPRIEAGKSDYVESQHALFVGALVA